MTKKHREARAIEAIIAGVLRGFDAEDWKRVFKRMDEIKRKKELEDRDYRDRNGNASF